MKKQEKNTNTQKSMEAMDTLHTQSNAGGEPPFKEKSGKELIEREYPENTPFEIITVEGGSFVAYANHRLTEFTTKDKCWEMIQSRDWNLICTAMLALISLRENIELKNN